MTHPARTKSTEAPSHIRRRVSGNRIGRALPRCSSRAETQDPRLRGPSRLLVAGAYDGLSARLVERAGFDAIWASGFCVSASRALADANVLSMDQLVQTVGEMTRAVSIPVIVDCDEGYGELANTTRLSRMLQAVGARAMSIEDSTFPKANSYFGVSDRRLVSVDQFVCKIQAIRESAPDMLIVARTEALIAGLGLSEALLRAEEYAANGADWILMHSAFSGLAEFRSMAASWHGKKPLVVVPTLAQGVTFSQLHDAGFQVVIYANQLLRASVRAMETVLTGLRELQAPDALGDQLSPLDHMFELTDMGAAMRPLPTNESAE